MKKIDLSKQTLRVLTAQEVRNVAGGATIRDECNPTETRPATGCGTTTVSVQCPTPTTPAATCPAATTPAATCPGGTSACPTETRPATGCPIETRPIRSCPQ